MLLPLFASAALAAGSPGGAADAPAPAAPPAAAPAPTIDSLLQPPAGYNSTDTDEDAGTPAPKGPVPYSQLDGKAYDDALKNAAVVARQAAGPLDGGWTLASADGRRLYRFQFDGRGYGLMEAEGAWRDLDGGPRLKGSGFLDQIGYAGDQLMLRFYEADPADEVVVTVKPAGTGAWSGQLRRHGAVTQVTFRKD